MAVYLCMHKVSFKHARDCSEWLMVSLTKKIQRRKKKKEKTKTSEKLISL